MTTSCYVRYVMSASELIRALDRVVAEGHLESEDRILAKHRHSICRSDGCTTLQFIKLIPFHGLPTVNNSSSKSNPTIALSTRYEIKQECFFQSMNLPVGCVGEKIYI